jgi:hypothetical protein
VPEELFLESCFVGRFVVGSLALAKAVRRAIPKNRTLARRGSATDGGVEDLSRRVSISFLLFLFNMDFCRYA